SRTLARRAITMTTLIMPALFFFQAEDGIRDFHVTGVQTCALPIYLISRRWLRVNGWERRPVRDFIRKQKLKQERQKYWPLILKAWNTGSKKKSNLPPWKLQNQ